MPNKGYVYGPRPQWWRDKIGAGNRGKIAKRTHKNCLNCGIDILAIFNQIYCSKKCSRGARGVTLVHGPAFAVFPRCCEICARTDELVGDHDHETNQPRGVLCRTCNLALGNMRDKPDLLRRAADYLEERAA